MKPAIQTMTLIDSIASKCNRATFVQSWSKHRLFWLCVVLPTILAVLYFGPFASDIYISESHFVVRSPEKQTTSPLGLIFKGAGFTRSQDDSYTVQDFILSRDALRALDEKLNLRHAFGQGDVFRRFPGLDPDDSFENLHRYYQKFVVGTQFDAASSIATVTVRAFAAEDALRINQMLLEMSETLVNRLNERGRQDMIRFAANEVIEAEKKAKLAALTLARYRNEKGVIDPERQSEIPLQQIARLQEELIAARTQLLQLQMLTKDNPQIPVLKKRIEALEDEVKLESARVTGGGRSLASKAAEFQRLALEKEFADKQLASAFASLEQARSEAQRQTLYLERIAQPSLPDEAMEPRRLRAILAVFVLGLITWGVLTMLLAGIKEHQD
jgi:capsular polysaccharide transport system permease protein